MTTAGDGGATGGAAAGSVDAVAASTTTTTATAAAATQGTASTDGKQTTASVGAAGAVASETGGTEFIPEKYRVAKEDGTLDLEASARKLADAHSSAEKRIGSGDIPPKTAEEYVVTVPEAFKDVWNPSEDQKFINFRSKAFESGMTQKHMDLVMASYFEIAPALVSGAAIMDEAACTEELKKTWATKASFDLNVGNAYKGTVAIATKAGLKIDDIMAPNALGNNAMFLKLMAAIGPEFVEDKSPGGDGGSSIEDINALMASEAYTNPKHIDHVKVSAKVKAHFERKHGTEAAA